MAKVHFTPNELINMVLTAIKFGETAEDIHNRHPETFKDSEAVYAKYQNRRAALEAYWEANKNNVNLIDPKHPEKGTVGEMCRNPDGTVKSLPALKKNAQSSGKRGRKKMDVGELAGLIQFPTDDGRSTYPVGFANDQSRLGESD